MSEFMRDAERLRAELPWYANGTLSAEQRTFVECGLACDPDARAELAQWQRLQTAVHARVEALPAAPGMERLMAWIAAEEAARPPQSAQRTHTAERTGWGARLAGWLFSRPAALALCTLVIAQGAVIGVLSQRGADAPEYATTRALAPAVQADKALLRIAIKADTPERELRRLVIDIDGTLVGGPSQLGDYYVAVAIKDRERVLDTLRGSRWVDSADEADALPTR